MRSPLTWEQMQRVADRLRAAFAKEGVDPQYVGYAGLRSRWLSAHPKRRGLRKAR